MYFMNTGDANLPRIINVSSTRQNSIATELYVQCNARNVDNTNQLFYQTRDHSWSRRHQYYQQSEQPLYDKRLSTNIQSRKDVKKIDLFSEARERKGSTTYKEDILNAKYMYEFKRLKKLADLQTVRDRKSLERAEWDEYYKRNQVLYNHDIQLNPPVWQRTCDIPFNPPVWQRTSTTPKPPNNKQLPLQTNVSSRQGNIPQRMSYVMPELQFAPTLQANIPQYYHSHLPQHYHSHLPQLKLAPSYQANVSPQTPLFQLTRSTNSSPDSGYGCCVDDILSDESEISNNFSVSNSVDLATDKADQHNASHAKHSLKHNVNACTKSKKSGPRIKNTKILEFQKPNWLSSKVKSYQKQQQKNQSNCKKNEGTGNEVSYFSKKSESICLQIGSDKVNQVTECKSKRFTIDNFSSGNQLVPCANISSNEKLILKSNETVASSYIENCGHENVEKCERNQHKENITVSECERPGTEKENVFVFLYHEGDEVRENTEDDGDRDEDDSLIIDESNQVDDIFNDTKTTKKKLRKYWEEVKLTDEQLDMLACS